MMNTPPMTDDPLGIQSGYAIDLLIRAPIAVFLDILQEQLPPDWRIDVWGQGMTGPLETKQEALDVLQRLSEEYLGKLTPP